MFKTTVFLMFVSSLAYSHIDPASLKTTPQTVLTNLDQAQALGGAIIAKDVGSNLAVSYLTPQQISQLSLLNHFQGRCAGFEVLSEEEASQPAFLLQNLFNFQNKIAVRSPLMPTEIQWKEEYQKLADQADAQSLKETVQWISSYPSRNDRLAEPNVHVIELKNRLETWLKGSKWNYQIDLINHKSTRQQSLRLKIPGKLNADEVIVLGAHFDSVNHSFFGNSKSAPGADDNASGSSNLIEALKILKTTGQPQRSLEFYWYAGEESGLLGSAEIAKEARAQNRKVIAVLQLDMTLHPGSGQQVVGLVNDFTSPWLRGVFTQMNQVYVKAKILDDTCGYGCSDHASWHRQSYHAVIPFEAVTETMNNEIHTDRDVINSQSSFDHSNTFTKYAILFAMVLGNSDLQPPSNN